MSLSRRSASWHGRSRRRRGNAQLRAIRRRAREFRIGFQKSGAIVVAKQRGDSNGA